MSNIEYLTQLKKELEKASNNVEKIKILKNNIPEDTIYTYCTLEKTKYHMVSYLKK